MVVRSRGRVAVAALLVALVCALGTYLVHRVFVGTVGGQWLDQVVLERASDLRGVAGPARTLLSDAVFTPIVTLGCLVLVVVAFVRRTAWQGVAALLLVAGANVTTEVLKLHVFQRPDLLQLGAPNSMPSGHTTAVSSLALALALLAPPALRLPAAVLGLTGSTLVGVATVVAGWHRLSDVAAALLVSMAWAAVLTAVLVLRPRRSTPSPAGPTSRSAYLAGRTSQD
jgi:membrane-associated phospholipid phosphatase